MKQFSPILFIILLLGACKKYDDHDFQKDTVVYKTIQGIDQNNTSLDIYHFGDKAIHPVLFWVHGGGWAIGDKTNQMETKLNWAYEKGYIIVSTNYRLSDEDVPLSDTSRIQFPDHPIDVADALAWTYHNIADYGGDPNKIVIFGHSAGAHLVSLIGVDTSYLTGRNLPLDVIKGVGSFDTQGYDVVSLMNDDPSDIYVNAFSNNEDLWEPASPQRNIGDNPTPPRFFIVTRGSDKRVSSANDFHDALENNGYTSQIIDADHYSHGKVNDKIGDPGDKKFMDEFDRFLEDLFN